MKQHSIDDTADVYYTMTSKTEKNAKFQLSNKADKQAPVITKSTINKCD